MPARLTHKQFISKVREIHGKSLTMLDTYTLGRNKMRYHCNVCGYYGEGAAQKFVTGFMGCAECGFRRRDTKRMLSVETVLERVAQNSNYKLLEPFREGKTKVACKCCGRSDVRDLRAFAKSNGGRGLEPMTFCCVNAARSNNSSKIAHNKKTVMLNGKKRTVQGYEPQAIKYLTEVQGIKERDIKLSRKNIPTIVYEYDGKTKGHRPDMFIPTRNIIVEVKSTYTAGLLNTSDRERFFFETLVAKKKAAEKAGYRYGTLIMTGDGPLSLPKAWTRWSHSQAVAWCRKVRSAASDRSLRS